MFKSYKKTLGITAVIVLMSWAYSTGTGWMNEPSDVLPSAGIFLIVTIGFLGAWAIKRLIQGGSSNNEKGSSGGSNSST